MIVLCIAVSTIAFYFADRQNTAMPETEPPSQTEEPLTVPTEYEEYYQKNNDFVGWIKIDGTHIDNPVLYSGNNSYYLEHNFEKEYYKQGSIFMDMDSSPMLEYTNTVLHGHNWLNTTTNFSELPQYSDIEFYREHPIIEFNTRTEMHKWKIFAVIITSADPKEDNGYVFNYLYPKMYGQNFEGFMSEINKRTIFRTGIDVNESDKILTLSTCTREADKGKIWSDCRIVIFSRMVREGESAYVNTSLSVKNENPKYPQIWYDNKGLVNPYINDEKWYPIEKE